MCSSKRLWKLWKRRARNHIKNHKTIGEFAKFQIFFQTKFQACKSGWFLLYISLGNNFWVIAQLLGKVLGEASASCDWILDLY